MTTIDKLRLYPRIPAYVKDLNKQLTTAISEKYNVCVTAKLTGLPMARQKSDPTYVAVERILTKHDKDIDEISRQISRFLTIHSDVSRMLLELTPEEKQVLTLRYFSSKRWSDVSRASCYSLRQCHRLHASGIKKIEKIHRT